MSRIGPRDTKPEMILRSGLHRRGFRFRIAPKELPGKPDLVLPRYRTAIFVHGCFWHRHRGCSKSTMPKTNIEFWKDKFDKNVLRDKRKSSELESSGWRVIVVWECEISKDHLKKIDQITKALKGNQKNVAI